MLRQFVIYLYSTSELSDPVTSKIGSYPILLVALMLNLPSAIQHHCRLVTHLIKSLKQPPSLVLP